MIFENKEKIIERLVSEFNYPRQGAEIVFDKLKCLDPKLREEFGIWWDGGEKPSYSVVGYTIEKLQKEHHLNTIAALLTLDWLIREPQKALMTLKKGHDYVKFKK